MKFLKFSVLFTFAGLALAGTVKEDLLKRLDAQQHQLEGASHEYTVRGFDYFAEVIQNTVARVEVTRSEVKKLADTATEKDAEIWAKEVGEIEKQVPDKIRFPALHEIFKTGGLYLAVMKTENHDTKEPSAEVLKKQVSDIVLQEAKLKTLKSLPEKEKEETALKAMYDALVNNIKDGKIPTPDDLNKLEIEAKKKIEQFEKDGKKEEAELYQAALNKFLSATYHAAKIYPIDSQTRFNQFLAAAPAHYQDYKILNALVFLGKLEL